MSDHTDRCIDSLRTNKPTKIFSLGKKKYSQFDSLEFEGYDDDDLTIFFYTILQLYHNLETHFETLQKENQPFEGLEAVGELIAKIEDSEKHLSAESLGLRGNIEKIRSFIQFQNKNLTCLFTLFDQFKALFIAKVSNEFYVHNIIV